MLSIQNVSKTFHRKFALDQVSFEIEKGEVLGLLGPNGAGKSTLIRVINQIVQANSGVVRFDGEIMTQAHVRKIGYLPEERGLYKSMKVKDQMLFLAKLRGLSSHAAEIQVNFWLDKMGITDWSNKRIEQLSKGMAQKVQFICAILHDPKFIILDEPFSGFDPINVELIKQEILEMKAAGKTIMISTHNMKSVEEICDRAVLIHQAKKIAEGRVIDLQDELKTGEYAVKFRGNMIAFVNALWTDFELMDKEILGDDRFIAKVRMRGEQGFEDLLKVLIGQVKIEAAWEVLPTMQDVFMNYVKSNSEGHEK